jgi:hypothetical protein
MTPGIPDPAKIAEVEGIGQGFRNSTTRRRAAVVISLPYTALREATRERERERVEGRGQRRAAHQEVEGSG